MSSPHANGAPHWFELATPDPAGAADFYTGLFDWTADAATIAGGHTGAYTVFRLGGRDVAGAYALPDALRAQGVPPCWAVYFRVDDVDAASARVVAAGGRVIVPPFEAGGHLRAAACADPEGAVFLLAQPRGHAGAAALREPGAVCWTELATRDLDRAQAFYGEVLGWTVQPHHASPPTVYRVFANGDGMLGGLLAMTPEWGPMPSHWALYVQVEDVDAVAARAQALGGRLVFPAFDAPQVGRIARIADPAGLGLYLIRFVDPA
ncbi:MAG: VOC family protein [Lysobacteraceae bacterium]